MALDGRTAGLTVLAMLAFAANSLLCRGALGAGLSDATTFTTLRLASGAVALGLLVRLRGGVAPPPAPGRIAPLALFAYALGFSLAYLRIPAATGALLIFAAVQLTMVAGGLVSGERPPLREWAGLGLSLAGLVILTRPGLAQPDPVGAALMVGAGVAWGVYSLLGRRSTDPLAANAASFVRTVPLALAGSLVALLFATPRLSPGGALLALTSGALTSGVGYAVWYAALRGLTATRAAVVQLSVPPLTALAGIVLLDERPTSRLVWAGLLILGGIALAVTRRRRRPADRLRDSPARGG